MATVTTDPLVGRLVDGRYEVVSRIARGGMATVYLARDRRLDRDVALKVMHPHLADGASGAAFVARFRREARAAARLTHRGLVAVYDQGVDGDTSYLTMEYVAGSTLRQVLRAEATLTVGRTLDVLADVLDALAAAHRTGLVHRDVKPENVLVDDQGQVKVADFGLARAVTEVTSTTTGTILGTVAYLSPELIAAGTCDPRTDVYAVGILAYEMITGTPPFGGESPIQVAFQHVNNDVPPPSDVAPWLPVEVDDLVRTLTARDPGERPADAGAALIEVRRTRAALTEEDLGRRLERPRPAAAPGAGTPGPEAPDDPAEDDDAGPDALAELPTSVLAGLGSSAVAEAGLTARVETGPGLTAPHDTRRLPRRRRPARVALWSFVVLLALAGAAGGAAWWETAGPGAYTTVPAGLVGLGADDARASLTEAGLEVADGEEHSDGVAEGHVVRTDPAPGDTVRKDGTVLLVVSLGVQMLEVPDGLVGASTLEATTALQGAGFEVGEPTSRHHDSVPAGEVLAVSHDEGSSQRHDTVVTLTVSAGPAPVVVPSVTAEDQEDAVRTLEGQGLRVDVAEEHSETVPTGTVIRQSPEQGTDGHRGDTVEIVVSLGPPPVEIPDVVRLERDAAVEALEDAGFDVEVDTPYGITPLNTVYAQDPPAGDGETAPLGSTITISVF